jgi:hypothetical protein
MPKLRWKTMLAVTAVLAATVYAFAQMSSGGPMGVHGQMQSYVDNVALAAAATPIRSRRLRRALATASARGHSRSG